MPKVEVGQKNLSKHGWIDRSNQQGIWFPCSHFAPFLAYIAFGTIYFRVVSWSSSFWPFCFMVWFIFAILLEILTIFASIWHYCTSRVPFCSDQRTHFVPVADLHLQKFTRSAYNSVSIHPYTKVLELPRGAYLGHPLNLKWRRLRT